MSVTGASVPLPVRLRNLTKSFTGAGKAFSSKTPVVRAVDDLSLDVRPGEILTLLGPSGCGKSTTLRCIAGLERPDGGEITLGSQTLFSHTPPIDVPASRRGIGMVFQSYALWPHLTVHEHVAFPLVAGPWRRRVDRATVGHAVADALSLVQLEEYGPRYATELSGGQQQRLALARALVARPPLLLLDEPLSSLDAGLRETVRVDLTRILEQSNTTALYVTHDQTEALALSDRVAVMREGSIEQIAAPEDLYLRPSSRFVAEFVGSSNVIPARMEGRTATGGVLVRAKPGVLSATSEAEVSIGDDVAVAIRPESISVVRHQDVATEGNTWIGVVTAKQFLGELTSYLVQVDGEELKVRCPPTLSITPGERVAITMPERACLVVPASNGHVGVTPAE